MTKDIDLRELNLENVGVWPFKIKVVVIAMCCVLLMGLGYWFDTKGQIQELKTQKLLEVDLGQQLELKYQFVINFPAYKKQLETIQKIFKEMLQQLPGQTEVPGLLEDISKAGVASGLEFKLFKPLPEKQMEFYAELPIEISVVGTYHNLGRFVSKVSALNRIVSLHDFTISAVESTNASATPNNISTPGEALIMSILAKTYRYSDEQKPKVQNGGSSGRDSHA